MPLRAAAGLLIACVTLVLQAAPATSARAPQIVGGTPVPTGEWPWTVYVQSATGACTGSLIGAYWVVTAAHCVSGGAVTVKVASVDLASATTISAAFVATNTAYNPTTFSSDVAVIRLSSPASATGILLLPPEKAGFADAFKPAWIAGWGELADGSLPQILQQAGVGIFPGLFCGASALQLCAGGGGRGACCGDSGGPLIVGGESNPPYLAGIAAATANPCGSLPAVFARVSAFAPGLLSYLSADPVAPVAAPHVGAVSATSTDGTAQIGVNANPENLASYLRIEYGISPSLGQSYVGAIGGGAPGGWVATLTGLEPGVRYSYRVTVTNSLGLSASPIASFTAGATPGTGTPAPPMGATPPPATMQDTELRAVAFRRSPKRPLRYFGPGRPAGNFAVAARFVTPNGKAVRNGLIGCGARVAGRQLPRYRDPQRDGAFRRYAGRWAICTWRVPKWAAGKIVKGYIFVERRNRPGIGIYEYSFRLRRR